MIIYLKYLDRTREVFQIMESIKLSRLTEKHSKQNIAIISANQSGILEKLTFEALFKASHEVTCFLKKYIVNSHNCIGLLMIKHVFIPAIIVSLQELNQCFIFLTPENVYDKTINTKFILSIDNQLPLNGGFIMKESLRLSTNIEIHLWMNDYYIQETLHYYKDIFCVMQTSGSSGENKIVRVPYKCIELNVISINKHFQIGEADTIYWGTPLTFDPTLVELLLGLLYGCTLYIVPEDVHLNPTVLHRVLFQIGAITCLQMVPSVFLRWTKQEITKILLDSSLRILILGGEQFPQEIIEYERKPDMKVFNIYGVTELSCWATIADLTVHTPRDEIPLGTALDDTYLEISNENEIYICSYTRYCLVNENQKPKSPFKVNSGDVGKLCNGILYFSGRKMRIIKRFGQKLVLHQVENVIFDQIGLRIRLVFSESHKKLLAFVLIEGLVNEGLKHRTLDKIRVKILNIVPEYSIPDFMDVVTHFPLNEHGKINEKALIKRYEESLHQSNHLQTVAENFTHILSEYLKYDLSGNLMKFQKYTLKEMGGNSYMTIQFLQTFEDKIGLKVPENLVKLLLNHTIEDCLKFIKENMSFKIKRKFIDDEALLANKRIPQLQESSIWFKYNLDGCVDASPLAFSFKESKYVACGSFAHKFVILHSETGEEYLKLQTEQEIAAQSTLSECGNYILVGSTNGCIYCIDLSLKSIRWQYQTGQQIKSAACNCSSTAIVFGSYDEFLYCLKVQDGSLIWKTKLFGQIRGDPLYENTLKIIYIGTTKGMCYAVNSENGHVIWSVDLQEPIFGSPAILEDCSIWTTVTGKIMKLCNNLVSSSHLKVDGRVFSSLKVYGEMAYFTCQDKYLYKISIRNFQLEKIVQCAGEISSSPFVFQRNTEVFVACACNSGILYIIDVNQKNILVQMHLPAETFSSPYVLDDKLYIGCRDDYLYCLNLEKLLILETE